MASPIRTTPVGTPTALPTGRTRPTKSLGRGVTSVGRPAKTSLKPPKAATAVRNVKAAPKMAPAKAIPSRNARMAPPAKPRGRAVGLRRS